MEEKEAEAEENKENENGEEAAEKEKENIGRHCGKMIGKNAQFGGKVAKSVAKQKVPKWLNFKLKKTSALNQFWNYNYLCQIIFNAAYLG